MTFSLLNFINNFFIFYFQIYLYDFGMRILLLFLTNFMKFGTSDNRLTLGHAKKQTFFSFYCIIISINPY